MFPLAAPHVDRTQVTARRHRRDDHVDRGVRAAAMCTLIGTAKLNDVEPQAWLADVLAHITGTPQKRIDELLPWNWQDGQ